MLNENENQKALLPIKVIKKVPIIESKVLSEKIGTDHESLIRLIKKHQIPIEENFGILRFEIGVFGKRRGQPEKTCKLTEDQAIFITTLSKNSKQVVELKSLIVRSFIFYRNKENEKQQKLLNRPVYKLPSVVPQNDNDCVDIFRVRKRRLSDGTCTYFAKSGQNEPHVGCSVYDLLMAHFQLCIEIEKAGGFEIKNGVNR